MLDQVGAFVRTLTRPVATFALVGTACAGFFMDKIPADTFVPLVTAATAFWFAARGNYADDARDDQ